ncbi:MAG: hypothetical protein N2379_02450 [Verrucomicrobiae bacterium]|nr:hypothetical protein [Verrucomicrobiae bacterium]
MLKRLTIGFVAGAVCAWSACLHCAAAEATPEPGESPNPAAAVAATNSQQTASRNQGEILLRQRIRPDGPRRVEVVKPDSDMSLRRPVPPPTLSPAQHQRLKEYMERRRYWVYMTLEELSMRQQTEEKLGWGWLDPAAAQKRKGSALERFYQRLKGESEARTAEPLPELMGESGSRDFDTRPYPESPLAQRLKQSEQTLQNIFQTQPAGDLFSVPEQKSASSIFPEQPFEPARLSVQTERRTTLEEFKRLLEPQQNAPALPAQSTRIGSLNDSARLNSGVNARTLPQAPGLPSASTPGQSLPRPGGSSMQLPGQPGVTPPPSGLPAPREPLVIPGPPQGPPQRKF